ncbi:MAG: hypothetical protein KCHDKBKB_00607 [Elusimicrobia bacterium]|nr:hypothetical protein [Elusimicrobiota bacterium]
MALNSWQKITRVLPARPFGTGEDGVYSSTTIPSLPNLSCSGTATNSTLTVSSTTLANGNVICIHQSRGTGAGQWEINRISSGGGTTSLTLQTPLQYTYTDSGASQAQVIKIPQYSSVTVESGTWTVPSWDGNVGGLFFFVCNGLTTITGTLSAAAPSYLAPGFNGGSSVGRNTQGWCGEGTGGSNAQQYTANGNAGGGGQGGGDAGGGAGGSNGTAGTAGEAQNGHLGGVPGSTSGDSGLTLMTFGGAGGAGGGDEDGNGSGTGGDGGGIVAIFSRVLTVTGGINGYGGYGTGGSNNVGTSGMGGGGGGAGGSLLICGQIISMGESKTNFNGGNRGLGGGTPPENFGGKGGYGGGGRIAIYYATSLTGTVSNYGTYSSSQDNDLNTGANCQIIW